MDGPGRGPMVTSGPRRVLMMTSIVLGSLRLTILCGYLLR